MNIFAWRIMFIFITTPIHNEKPLIFVGKFLVLLF